MILVMNVIAVISGIIVQIINFSIKLAIKNFQIVKKILMMVLKFNVKLVKKENI